MAAEQEAPRPGRRVGSARSGEGGSGGSEIWVVVRAVLLLAALLVILGWLIT